MTRCQVCDAQLPEGSRVDRRYCTSTCRTRAQRRRDGVKHGWGDSEARRGRRRDTAAVVAVPGQ